MPSERLQQFALNTEVNDPRYYGSSRNCLFWGRRTRQSIQISTTVSQHLRNILLVPLSAWDFGAAVNLFDGWFYRPRANRTNLFCLVVLVVDDAVLVEVVDKILSLFSGAISKQSLCRINLPCQSKVSACLKRFNDPPTLCKFSIKWYQSRISRRSPLGAISSMMFQTPSCPSLNRWLVRQASGWPTLSGHRCLGNMPIASRSCKRTPCILAKWGSPWGVRMRSYPIHAQLFDKLLNLWHLKGLTMH